MNDAVDGDPALWHLITARREAALATLRRDGMPQLSNVLYLADPGTKTIRISTTADRAKAKNVRRDPRAAIHVAGDDFWAYAVAEGAVTLSKVASRPDDEAVAELAQVHNAFYGSQPGEEFAQTMIDQRRLVLRLHVRRVYGLIATGGRRPVQVTETPPRTERAQAIE